MVRMFLCVKCLLNILLAHYSRARVSQTIAGPPTGRTADRTAVSSITLPSVCWLCFCCSACVLLGRCGMYACCFCSCSHLTFYVAAAPLARTTLSCQYNIIITIIIMWCCLRLSLVHYLLAPFHNHFTCLCGSANRHSIGWVAPFVIVYS